MEFQPPLADARNYPAATIKVMPNAWVCLNSRNVQRVPNNTDLIGQVDRARTGFYCIASLDVINTVWIPSYHCPALVEPILAANKKVRFYPVNMDLAPNFDFLSEHVQAGDTLVGIRFFGFECQIESLAVFANQKQLLLIEDLAHAAFVDDLFGEFAVTSLVKFYPTSIGAEIWVNKTSSFKDQLTTKYHQLANFKKREFKKLIAKIKNKLVGSKVNPYRYFNSIMLCKGLPAEVVQNLSSEDSASIIKKRQAHFRYIAEHLSGSPLGRVLFTDLCTTVPYVVPFLLNDADDFDVIRKSGLEVYRWEEMVDSNCEVANDYRSRLVQLPCHQNLTVVDLERIVDILHGKNDE